ncbi:hypothetical protein V5799_005644 [Amblyomma americanum]|uniref:Peptidase M13 C-terminal domain-containing protein n=1 Tax=Amblyomma americanum TaxID=6943 RepID=A0AAQ4DYP0_AMBAM
MFLSAAPSQYESTWSDDGRNGGLDDEVIGSKGIGGGGSEPGGCKRCTSHPTVTTKTRTPTPAGSTTTPRPSGAEVAARFIKEALNRSYAPCEDFYSFVCSTFSGGKDATKKVDALKMFLSELRLDISSNEEDPNFDILRRLLYLSFVYGVPTFVWFGAATAHTLNQLLEAESETRDRTLDTRTDSEGLVDCMGVQLAYAAFRSLPDAERRETLPGVDLTAEQIFFVSYCLKWCSSVPGTKRAPGGLYWHSRSRCIVPLRNMAQFAEAFSCKRGDPMNPVKKCSFW